MLEQTTASNADSSAAPPLRGLPGPYDGYYKFKECNDFMNALAARVKHDRRLRDIVLGMYSQYQCVGKCGWEFPDGEYIGYDEVMHFSSARLRATDAPRREGRL